MSDSEFVAKESCPQCGSRDNLARYSDGHGFCFGCNHWEPGDNNVQQPSAQRGKMSNKDLLAGEVRALIKRGITEETCRHFGYLVGEHRGKAVQIAPYYDEDGKVVAQKVRYPGKDFSVRGDLKDALLFGQNLWRDGGKMVVVTEGEVDALSVSQLQGNKWPVVSVPNGAQGAKKALARQLEWLGKFDAVVLMFDMDEPGRAAVEECAPLFPPGKCKVARLPLKDANEMLQAARGKEVIDAIWGAKTYRPDGIVLLSDIRSDVLKVPEEGLPWAFPTLTKLTYGRRLGEIYAIGAGTGVGKTDFLTQQIAFDLLDLKQPVGLFFLEQQPAETGKRIAGKVAKRCFHIPDAGWTQEELVSTLDRLDSCPLYLYDHFGCIEWENLRERIRFMKHSEGIDLIYLDHLTALAAEAEDERKELEKIMAQLGSLVKELNVALHLVSHLATPEGKPHEEGGRVMIRHFKGSRSIGFWSHYMIGLERDQQAENEEARQTTTVRLLKDRYTGRATGKVFYLGYDSDTGTLHETIPDFIGDETTGPDNSEF